MATEKKQTGLVVRENSLPILNMNEISLAGDLLAQASFLGAKNKAEGFLIMLTCQQEKISLLKFQQTYHMRQGRISMQAHAMLADFVERGGKYKLLERSSTRAALELFKGEEKYLSAISWEDALQEPFVYAGNETDQLVELAKPFAQRKLKAKYQTSRSRMQMLWARAISDGVVTLDPGARMAYTPEETEDFQDNRRGSIETTVDLREVQAAAMQATAATGNAATEVVKSVIQDAEVIEPEPQKLATTPATPATGNAAKLFNAAKEAKNSPMLEVDIAICPIAPKGAESLKGMKWTDMSVPTLKSALAAAKQGKFPEITAAHQAEIEKAIAAKEQQVTA